MPDDKLAGAIEEAELDEPTLKSPTDGMAKTQEAAQRRAQACHEEIMGCLERHRCRLHLYLDTQPAGRFGEMTITKAMYGIIPLED